MDDFEIGLLVKPQGIRGEIRVLPTTDDPNRFALLSEVFIRAKHAKIEDGKKKYKLLNARRHKGVVIIKLEGVDNRNAAEDLVGGTVTIPHTQALLLDDDEYYIRELIGLKVLSEEGLYIGILSEVLHTGANDVYVIKQDDGYAFMIPAIKDVVVDVSIPEGKITVRLTEGLRDLTKGK